MVLQKNIVMSDDGSELATIADVMGLKSTNRLSSFREMWYHIFLWALFSSIFIHTCAALVAFFTLPTTGVISSAVIAFVHRASSIPMSPISAMIWGLGQTILSGCLGFTRILATL